MYLYSSFSFFYEYYHHYFILFIHLCTSQLRCVSLLLILFFFFLLLFYNIINNVSMHPPLYVSTLVCASVRLNSGVCLCTSQLWCVPRLLILPVPLIINSLSLSCVCVRAHTRKYLIELNFVSALLFFGLNLSPFFVCSILFSFNFVSSFLFLVCVRRTGAVSHARFFFC